MAAKESQSKHDGLNNAGHCRPFSVFVGVTNTNSVGQSWNADQSLAALPVALDASLPTVQFASADAVELDTGPPPNNLVVALHRWLI
jgi:hypothetical protein